MKKIVGNRNILLLPAIHIVSNVKSITVFIKFNTIGILLWQPLDQCPIAAQVINLKERISSRNMSCVFTRELDREPQQYSTDYLYKHPWSML